MEITHKTTNLRPMCAAIWAACLAGTICAVIIYFFLRLSIGVGGGSFQLVTMLEFFSYVEPAEKFFFMSFFIMGAVAAYLAARFLSPDSYIHRLLWLRIFFFVPLFSRTMDGIFNRNDGLIWLTLAFVILLIPLSINGRIFSKYMHFFYRVLGKNSELSDENEHVFSKKSVLIKNKGFIFDVIVLIILALLLIPVAVSDLAARVILDPHIISFIVGPALYFFSDSLVPGLDYHSHYGIGQGFVFSFLLGENGITAMENYIRMMVFTTWTFYSSSYLILCKFLGSRKWALSTTLFGLILIFYGKIFFHGPSAYPIRFPLLLVLAWLFACLAIDPDNLRRQLAIGLCIGISLYWQTDVGIYMLCATSIGYFIIRNFSLAVLRGFFFIITTSLFSFLTISILTFGPRILTFEFFQGLINPLIMYSTGFVAQPLNWTPSWGYLYNIMVPVLSVATIGWCIVQLRDKQNDTFACRSDAFLLIMVLLGFFLMFKWLNRSYDAVWHQNAFPLIFIIAWWLKQLLIHNFGGVSWKWQSAVKTRKLQISMSLNIGLRDIAYLFLITIISIFLIFVQDSKNPQIYALRSFIHYPSYIQRSVKTLVNRPSHFISYPDQINKITEEDVALITDRTQPEERVMVVSELDWAYLTAAKRSPASRFVPITSSAWYSLIEESFEPLPDFIFVEKDSSGKLAFINENLVAYETLNKTVFPLLNTEYVFEDEGPTLVVFQRK